MNKTYIASQHLGSNGFGGYVQTPIFGPLTTNNYPNSLPSHNKGVLKGFSPNPPLFYPSQEPPSYSQFAMSRRMFARSVNKTPIINKSKPVDSSLHILNRKAQAVGKTTTNPNLGQYTTKNYDSNVSRSAIRRSRSSGYVVPPKCQMGYLTCKNN